ncbi:MAG: J domain-containing protein [Alphaproteobacteria bacterium]|jgi:DnaJ-class molecular chaperone|nr:J domain-containing protein [Alphaproteobacteria bacterium]
MRDLYEVLGVSRDAGKAEIKRAYRNLAKELHPDLNPDDKVVAERFKEVTAAYNLLSDKESRAKYDRGEIGPDGQARPQFRYQYAGGPEGGRGNPFGTDSADDMFRDFADLFGGLGRGRRSQRNRVRRGADRSYKITVEFLDAARGTTRRVSLPSGKTLDVKIPAGIEDGMTIRLKGQGEAGSEGGAMGDALIEVAIDPHPRFQRRGQDIELEVPITLSEAVLGAKISVPTIDGAVNLSIPKGSNSGSKLRLKKRGIATESGRGDQYVTLKVVLPDQPDDDLVGFVERWSKSHDYDVRGKDGLD